MSLHVSLRDTLGQAVNDAAGLRWNVIRYRKRAIGGCRDAEFRVTGNPTALKLLVEYLRFDVEIWNDVGFRAWWGFLYAVDVDATGTVATVLARGWWDILDWRYYSNSTGIHGYFGGSGDKHNLSEGSNITYLAQSFSATGTTWSASRIGVWVYKIGTRADNVVVDICADSAGVPGTVLATATITSAEVLDGANYIEKDLSDPVTVGTGQPTRWIRVSATGSPDASNYWQIGVNGAQGYTGGSLQMYTGTWAARPYDMLFKLIGFVVTTTQIVNAIVDYGQVVTGIDIADASTVTASPYRDGDSTLLTVVEELLSMGNGAGGRMLADMTPNRRLRIYTEPSSASPWTIRGATKTGASLDRMANAVSLAYTSATGAGGAGGTRGTTAFVVDDISVTRFGRKERLATANNIDAANATLMAALLLAELRYPQVTADFGDVSQVVIEGSDGSPIRRDTCPVGFWAKLANHAGAVSESAFTRGASLVFIDEAEYLAEKDEYVPVPKNVPSPLDVISVRDK
jgi:hypothetical protein